MMLAELIDLIRQRAQEVGYDKEAFKKALAAEGFTGKSVLVWKDKSGAIAAVVKLIDSKGSASSNTVTSLKNIRMHEGVPFIAVFLDKDKVRFRLMNSSLVRKVSHSSQKLTLERIVGSINGSDILGVWAGITNDEQGLGELFALHLEEDPQENLARIVAATQAIQGRAPAIPPDWAAVERNLEVGKILLDEDTLSKIEQQLFAAVQANQAAILGCAERTSPKAFGDCVERIILGIEPAHALGDIAFAKGRVAVDIKARQAGKASSPKAFNVQKLVDHLSTAPGAALYFFVSVDTTNGTVSATLMHMLHPDLFRHYWHDERWAGRGSLGTLALKGDLSNILTATHRLELEPANAVRQLQALLPKDDQAS